MKYYLDCEFIEGFHKPLFGKKRHFIDLISIGLVDESGREYYAISKDFDLKAVWNNKDTWVKENVLRPIHKELREMVGMYGKTYHSDLFWEFSLKSMKNLLRWYGKSNHQIANEIVEFIYGKTDNLSGMSALEEATKYEMTDSSKNPEFYAYYADYDWVLFCSLFGKMLDLPKGFPMYCRDLKQSFDEKAESFSSEDLSKLVYPSCSHNVFAAMDYDKPLITAAGCLKDHPSYPKQENEHNALGDARWNKRLHEFILSI